VESPAEEARPGGTALLRMELDAEERAVLHDGGEALARPGHGRRLGGVGVREPVRLAARLDLRPADPRHAALPQPDGAAGNEAERGHAAVLLRLVESELQAEADAEDRALRAEPLPQRLVEAAGVQAGHRGGRRADPGEDGEVGDEELVR